MIWLRRLLLWLPGKSRARARELQEEMRADLALAFADASDAGIAPEEAARRARRDFGSLTRAQEETRAVWFPGWDSLSQDVRFATRSLSRTPAFTLLAILSLGLGTGAATALFSLVDTVVLKPLAYREPERLVFAREVVPPLAHIYPNLPLNFQHFRVWREQSKSFDSLAAISNAGATLLTGGEPLALGGASVTANLFDVLGEEPQLGRTFQPGEDQPNKPSVVVITDGLWRRRFGGSPEIVGQSIRLDGSLYLVIGVLRPGFRFPKNDDLGPLAHLSERSEFFLPLRQALDDWGGDYDYAVFGRLRRGLSLAEASAELNVLESRIAAAHQLPSGLHVQARTLQDVMGAPARTSLTVLLAAVLMLVLIVCVNLANLLLARGSARAREFSLRLALGASRGRLLWSALVETLMLGAAGGLLGLAAAQSALEAFIHWAPVDLPRMDEVSVDGRVLGFAFVLSVLCGLLFGLLPALRLSRADPQSALRAGTHTISGSRHGLQLRQWLVGAEVSLSTLLLVLAGLLVSSLWHVLHVDRGFTAGRALEVRVSLPSRYRSVQDRAAFFDLADERLRALPGVSAVSASSRVPLTGESNVNHVSLEGSADGALDPATRQLVMVNDRFVGPGYFNALGIPLLRGRTIEPADRDRNVVVISERLAAKLWPGQNPLGKVIISAGSSVSHAEVVGIVGDVHSTRLERDPTLMIYAPYWKSAWQVSGWVIRSSAGSGLQEEVRRTIQSIDSGIPAPRMRSMEELVSESVAGRRFQMDVSVAFAVAALLLAALGIYGVVAYGIALRRRELGIRIALGGRAGQIRRMLVRQGLRPVSAGLACGMSAALAAGPLIRSLLFGVSATDFRTLGAMALVLASVALLACVLPAHTITRIHPMGVLREE